MPKSQIISASITDGTIVNTDIADSTLTTTKLATPNLGRRNLIINGAMQVSQRATLATGLGNSNGYKALDRFGYFSSGAGRFSKAQEDVTDLVGFTKSMKIICTTADTSVDATDYMHLTHNIEGRDLQHLAYNTANAKPLRVSFYVKGNAAATYTFRIQTHKPGGTSRWFAKEFSVTTSWTRIIIEVPGDTDTNSNYGIQNSNLAGIYLIWYLQGGSNYSSGTYAESTWQERDYTKAVGNNQSNFFDSTSRTFEIAGVQMEEGTSVTPFEHRSFAEELALCQRYYQVVPKYTFFIGAVEVSSNSLRAGIPIARPLRASPAIGNITLIVYDDDDTSFSNAAHAVFANSGSHEVDGTTGFLSVVFNGNLSGRTDNHNVTALYGTDGTLDAEL